MTRIALTGGSGFLGSHIADVLAERGNDVVVFDRERSPHLRPEHEFVAGDVTDRDALARAFDGADAIYHLAALSDLNVAKARPFETAQVNVVGTVNALEAARETGARRFLFASTVYVYSRQGGFYRASKQACESYIEEFRRQFDLDFTILRYGSLYGPRADERNGIYRLLKQAAVEGRIEHAGSPEDKREYVHVRDAAELSADALDEKFANSHITITGHHPTRIADVFTMFSEILGREIDVEYVDHGEGHYSVTPYAYAPTPAKKLTSNYYVDMGEGVLQVLSEILATQEQPR
jgi:UDP-glucose 4-epimerase